MVVNYVHSSVTQEYRLWLVTTGKSYLFLMLKYYLAPRLLTNLENYLGKNYNRFPVCGLNFYAIDQSNLYVSTMHFGMAFILENIINMHVIEHYEFCVNGVITEIHRHTYVLAVCYCRLGYIFWTNSMQHSIKRAMLNGTNVTQFVTGDIGYPGQSHTYHCSTFMTYVFVH